MSNQDDTDTPARATVPQILAHLIVLGQQLGLPDPNSMDATQSNGIASVDFRSVESMRAWALALGASERVRSHRMGAAAGPLAGYWHHGAHGCKVLGWSVNVIAVTPADDPGKPIDHDVLTTLETLAGVR